MPKKLKLKLMLLLPKLPKLKFKITNWKLRLSPRRTPLILLKQRPITKLRNKMLRKLFSIKLKFIKLPLRKKLNLTKLDTLLLKLSQMLIKLTTRPKMMLKKLTHQFWKSTQKFKKLKI
jgi:hypothetical protein